MKYNNIMSLFDGLSGFQIALNRANIKYQKYFSSETDKYSIEICQKNFPKTIQLGDIVVIRQILTWKQNNLDKFFKSKYISEKRKVIFKALLYLRKVKFDILCGGSPCQGFSLAGKQLNFNDPRSKLFFEYVKILNCLKTKNPKLIFILENVKMKKEYKDIISNILDVKPLFINSNLVSAQNRQRFYWTNIGLEKTGLFGFIENKLKLPSDKKIFLKDILQDESEIDEKYYLSEKLTAGLLKHANKRKQEFKTHSPNGKAKCVTVSHQKQNLDSNYVCVAMRGRNIENGKRKDYTGDPTVQRLEVNKNNKTNCITSVQKDNLVLIQNSHGFNNGGVFKDKCPTLTKNSWEHNNHILNGSVLRRLTPIECERLQTIPDNFTEGVSNSQRYMMLGNSFTVDVFVHFLEELKNINN